MKKLFIILFAFMLAFSGCGWEVEIVDPSEQIAELEKPETEKPSEENAVTEEFVEEVVLNFGAEKLGEGKYISEKNRGFLYEMEIQDASNLEMKYYFSWAGKIFRERYEDWNSRFASPHGENMGFSYPAEEFEEIIETYFGTDPKKLRSDTNFYCQEHNAYCSPGGGAGFGDQYDIRIVSYIKSGDMLRIELDVGMFRKTLSVNLPENGGYRYISCVAKRDFVEEDEPQKAKNLFFSFGGSPKEMETGESYANWTFENGEVLYNSDGSMKYVTAEFSADFDMALVGHIERSPLFELSENIFDFTPWAGDEGKIPGICNTPFTEKTGHFMLDSAEEINIPELDYDESLPCIVTINSYKLSRGYTMTSDGADLVSLEPLWGKAKLSEIQEEMILNFGAEKNEFGAIQAEKTGSLYFNTDGCEDLSALGETGYFVWAMFHFGNEYDYETRKELFGGAGEGMGWAFPSEYYEPAVFEFFGVPAETLRKGECYNAEKDYYNIPFGGGIGDTPFIIVNSVEETAETVVFHITLRPIHDDDTNMVLTVKILPDGGYNYLSYMPED
ncbi:MAG: hypothetical protein IJB66_02695 [Oscillospiraceae bacterium]|nr:hypothetical protein [Oscillospiraceae bacterium]